MLKHTLVTLICLVSLAALVGLVLPSTWDVSRTAQIQNDIPHCHAVVGDLETWQQWSPWSYSVDGQVRFQQVLSSQGPGATLNWNGPKIGAGKLTVLTESRVEGLTFDLALRGGAERVQGAVTYRDINGSATSVTMTMHGDVGSDLIGRYRILVRTYTVGPDVVDALTRLKRRVETGY